MLQINIVGTTLQMHAKREVLHNTSQLENNSQRVFGRGEF